MEAATAKRDHQNEIDNFTSIDLDILLMQNKSLMTELARLKSSIQEFQNLDNVKIQSNQMIFFKNLKILL